MSLFQKRHYDALARVLLNCPTHANIAHDTLSNALADMLASDNPKFKRGRFLAAAGSYAENVKPLLERARRAGAI